MREVYIGKPAACYSPLATQGSYLLPPSARPARRRSAGHQHQHTDGVNDWILTATYPWHATSYCSMCGPKLAEMVNGQITEYYERMLEQLKTVCQWDMFLDEQFEAAKSAGREESIEAEVTLHTVGKVGPGSVRRVGGISKLLTLTTEGMVRHFSSKDVITMVITSQAPQASP